MRGIQCFVFCALLYSIQVDAFGFCSLDSECPDNAECDDNGNDNFATVTLATSTLGSLYECECKEGFDEIDLPDITIDGQAVTVCVDLGICTPFDNKVDDCGGNGQCAIIQGEHGIYKAVCKCEYGYYGKFCDEVIQAQTTTTPYSTKGTTKRFTQWVLLEGGAILLAVLAGGAAVAASSSG